MNANVPCTIIAVPDGIACGWSNGDRRVGEGAEVEGAAVAAAGVGVRVGIEFDSGIGTRSGRECPSSEAERAEGEVGWMLSRDAGSPGGIRGGKSDRVLAGEEDV